MKRLVIFDVDHTLIEGHLLILFLTRLLARNPFHALHFVRPLFKALHLFTTTMPLLVRASLQRADLSALDDGLQLSAHQLYSSLYLSFDAIGLREQQICTFAKHTLVPQLRFIGLGVEHVKKHLKEKDTFVALVSGSPHQLVWCLRDQLVHDLRKQGADYPDRLFALGTQRDERGRIRACVGSAKKKLLLNHFLRLDCGDDFLLSHMYSDNQFLADLPLLIEAEHGVVVHRDRSQLYDALPREILHTLSFYTGWYDAVSY